MQRRFHRALCAAAYIFFLACNFAQAQKPVLEFYGVKSLSSDKDMIKLTQDLFLTQLNDMDTFVISDKRTNDYKPDTVEENTDYVFFAEISETAEGWQCVLNIIQPESNKKFTNTKFYDSYYKILIESKAALSSLLSNVQNARQAEPSISVQTQTPQQSEKNISFESLAGTWKGEPYIDKIMILKGSRGFIIYKNGATMNISLSIRGSTVTALQTSKSNASFFPELPREDALLAARNAIPIEWTFSINNGNTVLTGERKSLSKTTPVTWTKQ